MSVLNWRTHKVIFVTVGSRNYPFDRLFKKLDELYDQGVLKEPMFAQTGTSSYIPKNYEYKDSTIFRNFIGRQAELF